MQELAQKLTDWIKRQVQEAQCNGAVLGLSGGIDSAVVAVLCKNAFPQNTLAVILPCHSSKADMTDRVSGNCNVNLVPIFFLVSIVTVPPSSLTMSRTTSRPTPLPDISVTSFRVEKSGKNKNM